VKKPAAKAVTKKSVKKAAGKQVKATRYCLGKCQCGSPCCYDKGHTGAHKCISHA